MDLKYIVIGSEMVGAEEDIIEVTMHTWSSSW